MLLLAYLREIVKRFKYQLGGGSTVIIAVGIYERYISQSISWAAYLLICGLCFMGMLILHGVDQYRVLLPKLKIGPPLQYEYLIGQTRTIAYMIPIMNMSRGKTIKDVSVILADMSPNEAQHWGRVPLHLRHDNAPLASTEFRYTTRFDLDPGPPVDVDLAYASIGSEVIMVFHTALNVAQWLPRLEGRYLLTIVATGTDVPEAQLQVELWMGREGRLCCTAANSTQASQ